ncbi:calcium-binding protein [Rhizobium sp. G21]|uniref:calcium-binding protein n=1 Tax=Rhizobium sp. G21 TaxID=2758439 RepID=UPI0016040492|nr:hypothetical protein [Rhizobium sp. G21]MBB1247424.1 hypothetical protein [Rhizobium sp. G21]
MAVESKNIYITAIVLGDRYREFYPRFTLPEITRYEYFETTIAGKSVSFTLTNDWFIGAAFIDRNGQRLGSAALMTKESIFDMVLSDTYVNVPLPPARGVESYDFYGSVYTAQDYFGKATRTITVEVRSGNDIFSGSDSDNLTLRDAMKDAKGCLSEGLAKIASIRGGYLSGINAASDINDAVSKGEALSLKKFGLAVAEEVGDAEIPISLRKLPGMPAETVLEQAAVGGKVTAGMLKAVQASLDMCALMHAASKDFEQSGGFGVNTGAAAVKVSAGIATGLVGAVITQGTLYVIAGVGAAVVGAPIAVPALVGIAVGVGVQVALNESGLTAIVEDTFVNVFSQDNGGKRFAAAADELVAMPEDGSVPFDAFTSVKPAWVVDLDQNTLTFPGGADTAAAAKSTYDQALHYFVRHEDVITIVGTGSHEPGRMATLEGTLGPNDIRGANVAEFITANVGDDRVRGGGGNDVIYGDMGKDVIAGGGGADRLHGGFDNDTVTGDKGNDYIVGGTGNDLLRGGVGSDTLVGDMGADILFGGAGRDKFVFNRVADSTADYSSRDSIFDFSRSDRDVIDLSMIDANQNKKGNQAFEFLGAKSFTEHAGELRLSVIEGNRTIFADVDGDGSADIAITLGGFATIRSSDFLL